MLNTITIMGRLTKTPELKQTQSGTAVTTFTLAVERDYKDQDGAKQTDFIDCVAWRATAEFVARYFSKGRMLVASGSLQSRKWQDKEGNNRVSWEVIVSNAYFGDSKKDDDGGGRQTETRYQEPSQYAQQQFSEIDDDGDFPF